MIVDTLLAKVIGTQNERDLKRLRPYVAAINAKEPEIQKLSDEQLRGKTAEFRARLANGETLDDILFRTRSPSSARRAAACSTCGTSTSSSSAAWCCTAGRSRK